MLFYMHIQWSKYRNSLYIEEYKLLYTFLFRLINSTILQLKKLNLCYHIKTHFLLKLTFDSELLKNN